MAAPEAISFTLLLNYASLPPFETISKVCFLSGLQLSVICVFDLKWKCHFGELKSEKQFVARNDCFVCQRVTIASQRETSHTGFVFPYESKKKKTRGHVFRTASITPPGAFWGASIYEWEEGSPPSWSGSFKTPRCRHLAVRLVQPGAADGYHRDPRGDSWAG